MQILILSDTHGFVDPRVAALAQICDRVVHAGDIGNLGVLRQLDTNGSVIAVRGMNRG